MARRGRPPQGPELVDSLDASQNAKERLKLVLRTLTGELSVAEACAQLGVGEARFHALRLEALEAAGAALEPRPPGRPPTPEPTEEAREAARLRKQVVDLSIELRAAQVREEIALISPHLLKRGAEEEAAKKKPPPSRTNSGGGTNSTPSGSAPSSGTSR